MKKLCVCIPTFNRSKCIEQILKTSVEWSKKYDIDFYIVDSSNDGKTQFVVDQYKELYGGNLIYEFISNYPDKTTDLKVAKAFDKIQDKYEYIHLSGDGLVIDFSKYIDLVFKCMKDGYDVVLFNDRLRGNINQMDYTNGYDFALENAWLATYYGASIVSSEIIKKTNYMNLTNYYRNSGFMYWFGLISSLASNDVKIKVYKVFPMSLNPFKPTNSSNQPGKFINFWVMWWNKVIDDLPSYYNDIKNSIKKDMAQNMKWYTLRHLLHLRGTYNLDRVQLKDKKEMISQVTDVPFLYFEVVSIIPVRIIECLKHVKKSLLYMIKRRRN